MGPTRESIDCVGRNGVDAVHSTALTIVAHGVQIQDEAPLLNLRGLVRLFLRTASRPERQHTVTRELQSPPVGCEPHNVFESAGCSPAWAELNSQISYFLAQGMRFDEIFWALCCRLPYRATTWSCTRRDTSDDINEILQQNRRHVPVIFCSL